MEIGSCDSKIRSTGLECKAEHVRLAKEGTMPPKQRADGDEANSSSRRGFRTKSMKVQIPAKATAACNGRHEATVAKSART